MAASSTISRDAPSQFAALLRRSKFASYDQKIGQVYTAFGGHAHRGDWGLKRPLPQKIRVRRPLITIASVDSINEQTEWERCGPSARFVEQWNEMGVDQLVSDEHAARGAADFDSEFARKPGASDFERQTGIQYPTPTGIPVKNIERMQPHEFERYLERLRKLRPKFQAWVISDSKAQDMLASAGVRARKNDDSDFRLSALAPRPKMQSLPDQFISQEVSLAAGGDGAPWIEQRPHPVGGLSYASTSSLQSHFLFRPVRGRLVTDTARVDTYGVAQPGGVFGAAVGGVVAAVEGRGAQGLRTMDFGPYARPDTDPNKYAPRDPHQGVVALRIASASVYRTPTVVGEKPQDVIKGAQLKRVRAEFWNPAQFQNGALPGTREWVASQAANTVYIGQGKHRPMAMTMKTPTVGTQDTKLKRRTSAGVMGMLGGILKKQPLPKDEDEE